MRDVVDAFVEKLTTAGARVHKGRAPAGSEKPYTVVYAARPAPGDFSEARDSKSQRWRIATLYVGNSMDSALSEANLADGALQDKRLIVEGRNCSKMTSESGRPIEPDPDDDSVFSGTDAWVFTTTPA